MKFIVEYDTNGRMRVVKVNLDGTRVEGPYASFRSYASLEVDGKLYIAVGDYFEGGLMRTGVVYEARIGGVSDPIALFISNVADCPNCMSCRSAAQDLKATA